MKRTQVVTLPKRMRYGPRYVQPAHLPVPSTEIVAMFFFPRRPFPAGVASISPTSSAYISVSEATTVAEERGLGGTKEKKTTAQRCIRTQRLRISKVAESEGDGLGYLYFYFFISNTARDGEERQEVLPYTNFTRVPAGGGEH